MSVVRNGRDGRRLRVLVLARTFPNSVLPTLGLWVERPMAALADRCDVTVISPVPYCPPLPGLGPLKEYSRFRNVARTAGDQGIRVFHPRFLVGPGMSLHSLEHAAYHRGIQRVVDRLWREQPFDLVHANFIYPDGVVAHRLSGRYGVPFVVTEHAPWTEWLEWRGVQQRALPAARAASAVLAVSYSVRESILAHDPSLENVRVLPVGVDGGAFPLANGRRSADQILYVGFINVVKGVDVLLHAMAVLREHGLPGRLVVAGGSHYLRMRLEEARIRRLAADLDLEDRVDFVGVRTPDEISELMRKSALLVLPSRAESFGAVLIEALASGTPVVATRCGGPEDIVTPDVGLLVPPEDPAALADALATVLSRRDQYAPDELRQQTLTRFGLTHVVDRLHGEYVRAVGSETEPRDSLGSLERGAA